MASSSSSDKLYGLDHLRALAITLVFVFHYGRLFPSPAWVTALGKFGWTGVDLFFVLSGFLIASQLFARIRAGKGISLRQFFIKRFFRIIPGYLIVVTLYFLFPIVHEREALAPLWRYLTFTQNLGLDLRSEGTFSHAWSLCIEEQFYLLLPLVLGRGVRKGWILASLFVAGIVLRYMIYRWQIMPLQAGDDWVIFWYKYIYYPTYTRLDGLLTGVCLAAMYVWRGEWMTTAQQHSARLLIAGLATLTIAYFVCEDEHTLTASVAGFTIVALGYGSLVAGVVVGKDRWYARRNYITSWLATLSYAIYLVHKMVIHVVQEALAAGGIAKDGNVALLACTIACIAAALALHYAVERPLAKIRQHILSRPHK